MTTPVGPRRPNAPRPRVASRAAGAGAATPLGLALVHGEVAHRRARRAANAFTYPAFCLRLPLSAPADARRGRHRPQPPRLGVVPRPRPRRARRQRARCPGSARLLAARGRRRRRRDRAVRVPAHAGLRVQPGELLGLPRPRRRACARVLCEVCNTFGERHNYLLAHPTGARSRPARRSPRARSSTSRRSARSAAATRSASTSTPSRWLARIDYYDDDGATDPLLETWISGRATPLGPRAPCADCCCATRCSPLGVVARIHWQALEALA